MPGSSRTCTIARPRKSRTTARRSCTRGRSSRSRAAASCCASACFLDPAAPGTEVSARRATARYPVKALAIVLGQAIVTVAGKGMVGVHGIAARTFGALEAEHLSVSTIFQASSESSIGFTLPETEADRAVNRLKAAFATGTVERAHRQRHRAQGHGGPGRRRRRDGRIARRRRPRLHRAGGGRDQRRRDRAGIVGAEHLVRGDGRRRARGRAPRPRGVPAVQDWRRRPAVRAADRRRPAWLRPRGPRARRPDRGAERTARRARRRPARPVRLRVRAARDLAAAPARTDPAEGRRRAADLARRTAVPRRPRR